MKDEVDNLTAFERAYSEYRKVQYVLHGKEVHRAEHVRIVEEFNVEIAAALERRSQAISELRQYLTDEAFAQLMAVRP